jgi:DNA-binding XRE family transcriptional regulator
MSIAPTFMLDGQRFVILRETEYKRLTKTQKTSEPMLPPPDAEGNYPAVETMRAMLAQKIIRRRRALGLSQVKLARQAGIRPETLNRLEQGKHSPCIATVDKLDRALSHAEAKQ